MARYLLASTPVHGHVAPMTNIAAGLVRAGHRVRFLTGALFREAVEATGAQHVALPAAVDYDARDIDAAFPGRTKRSGLRKLTFDVRYTFIEPVRAQAEALRTMLDAEPADAVLAETTFFGVLPLLLDPRPRPAVVSVGITVLPLLSRDTAPFGLGLSPSSTAAGHVRNGLLNFLVRRVVFGPNQRRLRRTLQGMGLSGSPPFFFDWPKMADRFLQLSVPGLEYPRSDLPAQIRFVGPPPPHEAIRNQTPPPWWDELLAARRSGRPVIHVTQGTLDTSDLTRVIAPALRALAGKDVFVVVTTGGRDPDRIPGGLPANARAATYLPYADLLPHVDLAITNGGFGGAQLLLTHGIPLIVAGDTEDKPEVAGRVAASGAGINMRTGNPTAPALAAAVETVLRNPTYRQRARILAAEYAGHDTIALIEAELADVTRQRSTPVQP
jgi:UDP:flavonoid glycosyltransferase YjiC (YdhE family)